MRHRRLWVFGMLAVFILTGCFRPASETSAPTMAEPLDSVAETPLATIPPLVLTTPTLPPVTIISPPTRSFGQSLDSITATATLSMLQQPTQIPAQTSPTAASGQVFITPGVPMGAVTIVAATATTTPSGLITPTALVEPTNSDCVYVVSAGDNLFRIAVNNGFTLEELRAANPDLVGEAPILQVGQTLQLPGCAADTVPATAAPSAVPAATSVPGQSGTAYTVQPGDTLFSIATRFGTTIEAIVSANNLANPNSLDVGQQLTIPAP